MNQLVELAIASEFLCIGFLLLYQRRISANYLLQLVLDRLSTTESLWKRVYCHSYLDVALFSATKRVFHYLCDCD